jgi:lipoprotein NlpD
LSSCGTPYGIYHRVEKGQTLYAIAKSYNVSPKEIIRINRLKEPVNLREGDAVFIPGASRGKAIEATIDYKTAVPSDARITKQQVETPRRDVSTANTKPEKGRFIWPVEGRLVSEFGIRNGERHAGIDIKADEGTPVKAADSGKVIYSGNGLNGYGNLIIIKHEGTFFTVYAHNKRNLVEEGGMVERGDVIAEVGSTGNASTPHLHFEVRRNKTALDPTLYLP